MTKIFMSTCPHFQFHQVPMLICWILLDIAQEQRKKEQAAAEAAKRQQEKKEEQSLRYRNQNRSARNKQRDSGTPTWHLNGEHDMTFYNGGIKQQKMWTVASTQVFRDTDLNGRPHWLKKRWFLVFIMASCSQGKLGKLKRSRRSRTGREWPCGHVAMCFATKFSEIYPLVI